LKVGLFAKAKKQAESLWDKQLAKIDITESNQDKKTIFYTALYHTMVQPNNIARTLIQRKR
jgi:putative alpha-1,2-mannosidase